MRLVVFFTRNMSLTLWKAEGILERELALYRQLARHGVRTSFVTYGGPEDEELAQGLPEFTVCCNASRLPFEAYAEAMPSLFGEVFSACDAMMTNQTNGAEFALACARRWEKPLVARCGYMWSEFCLRRLGPDAPETVRAFAVEAEVFPRASAVVTTTPMMRDDILERLPDIAAPLHVIPNYVEPAFYAVSPDEPRTDVIFVGRLAAQKNVRALIEAVRDLGCSLQCVGGGELRPALEEQFGDLGGRLAWRSIVPHADLPGLFAGARLAVLPSYYEGHPKTLIEAMAAGVPVIGADSPGIRELIKHGETGLLCSTDKAGIAEAIERLLKDGELRRRLAASGRAFSRENYHLERVGRRFSDLFASLTPGVAR